ncbi:MAG: hypothetical protein WCW27_02425 [Patescibacteria group bacterium]|jgi:hypothetical protein
MLTAEDLKNIKTIVDSAKNDIVASVGEVIEENVLPQISSINETIEKNVLPQINSLPNKAFITDKMADLETK